jgi:hypothetical protein
VVELTDDEVRLLRLRACLLSARARRGVRDVVSRLVGVQAQDRRSAALAVRARSTVGSLSDVEAARVRDRSVVRGWFMRGTLHLVATPDLGWLLGLLGPGVVSSSRRRLASLGVDESHASAVVSLLSKAGPSTRAEIAAAIGLSGQAVYHAVRLAGLSGSACYGPLRDGEETWVLARDWLGPGPSRPDLSGDAALCELARRYLAGYGPASPLDLAAWSGLPAPAARRAFALVGSSLRPVSADRAALGGVRRPAAGRTSVRLLPEFDPYLLGYRDRSLSVPRGYERRVHRGGGLFRPTITRDGLAVGVWTLERGVVRLDPFEGSGAAWRAAAIREARAVERFLS